ncbi:MAG: long-chain fatty acid--CoA ligase [Actinobacteria bacterium]|nr:long-chain fatty acid--CoA ligase [Actinomycetota bacterium]
MAIARELPDIAARLRETAAAAPDRVALRWQDRSLTYGELDARVDAAAGALQHLGVVAGDRVAVVLGNVPAFVEAHFGALRAGAAVVPLNTGLTSDELRHALEDSGARVVVGMAAVADVLLELRDELPDLEHVVVAGGDAGVEIPAPRWRDLLAEGRRATEGERRPDDLAALVYTSGTTGRPRGAMLTRANLAANQDQSLAGRFRIEATDTVLLVLPLFHIYALNVGLGTCVRVGATMALVERFDPVGSLDEIRRHEVTIVLGAPPMYVAWLNVPGDGDPMATVRLAVSGAAPLPRPVLDRFRERFGITIEEGYGLTEAAPSVTSNSTAPEPRAGTVGMPLPGIELRLVDEAGLDVDTGDPGEVWVRGRNVFVGYWNDPEATAAALTPDGWLRTGDVGVCDGDGYLRLVDRKQDLIIVSGFNVYPGEVERVLYQHDAVAECAVVGVAHPYTGEAVKAFVVPREGAEVSEDDIVAFSRSLLARYKCPASVEVVTELPHTATGKVRRAALRDRP